MEHLRLFDTEAEFLTMKPDINKPWVTRASNNLETYYSNRYEPKTNGYEYVDLGLPSGTLWATCNVGANSETEVGKYFAWGETIGFEEGVDHNFLNEYKFINNEEFTKYNFLEEYGYVDNKGTLEEIDDAAHINMGGDWRMPTASESLELLNNTNFEYVETYNGIVANGIVITSKIDSTKKLFLPLCGSPSNTLTIRTKRIAAAWTSDLLTSDPDYSYYLRYDNSGGHAVPQIYRHTGLPIRGVISKS